MKLPPADLVDRFLADLEVVWPSAARTSENSASRLGLAVSGGADSLALMLLAHAALPGQIAVASVDHRLRPESANEVAMVADLCRGLGIPCHRLAVDLAPGNTQDRARQARYVAMTDAFASDGIGVIATAHHADDQAETLLMRLNRGAGLQGLAGVRPRTTFRATTSGLQATLVRPLLGWRREELAAIVGGAGLEPAHDPSNQDEHYDRVRVRAAIAGADWLDPLAMATSARHLAEAGEAVKWAAEAVHERYVIAQADGSIVYFGRTPRLVEIEVVRGILQEFGASPERSAIARMIDQLTAKQSASLGGVLARCTAHHSSDLTSVDAWLFQREPPRKAGM